MSINHSSINNDKANTDIKKMKDPFNFILFDDPPIMKSLASRLIRGTRRLGRRAIIRSGKAQRAIGSKWAEKIGTGSKAREVMERALTTRGGAAAYARPKAALEIASKLGARKQGRQVLRGAAGIGAVGAGTYAAGEYDRPKKSARRDTKAVYSGKEAIVQRIRDKTKARKADYSGRATIVNSNSGSEGKLSDYSDYSGTEGDINRGTGYGTPLAEKWGQKTIAMQGTFHPGREPYGASHRDVQFTVGQYQNRKNRSSRSPYAGSREDRKAFGSAHSPMAKLFRRKISQGIEFILRAIKPGTFTAYVSNVLTRVPWFRKINDRILKRIVAKAVANTKAAVIVGEIKSTREALIYVQKDAIKTALAMGAGVGGAGGYTIGRRHAYEIEQNKKSKKGMNKQENVYTVDKTKSKKSKAKISHRNKITNKVSVNREDTA